MAVVVVLLSWQYYSINTPDTATKRQQPTATSLHPFTIRSSLSFSPSSPHPLPLPYRSLHLPLNMYILIPLTLPHPSLLPSLSLFCIFPIHQLSPFPYLTPSLFLFYALFFIISHFIFPYHRPSSFSSCPPSSLPPPLRVFFFCLSLSHSLSAY